MIILSTNQDKNRIKMPSTDTQFKPGESGNPGGRPKRGWNWAKLFEQAVEEELTTKDGTITAQAKQFIVKKLVRMAVDGDMSAVKEIMNRMDGMPKQSIDQAISIVQPILGGQTNVHPYNGDSQADETPQEN